MAFLKAHVSCIYKSGTKTTNVCIWFGYRISVSLTRRDMDLWTCVLCYQHFLELNMMALISWKKLGVEPRLDGWDKRETWFVMAYRGGGVDSGMMEELDVESEVDLAEETWSRSRGKTIRKEINEWTRKPAWTPHKADNLKAWSRREQRMVLQPRSDAKRWPRFA